MSSLPVALPPLDPDHHALLADAVGILEQPTFVARLADYAGQPVNSLVRFLPRRVSDRLRDAVRTAIFGCLEAALESLEGDDAPASNWTAKFLAGISGGVGGFFGLYALPIELPLTTTLMLRAIVEIAREEGEDLSGIEGRLACIEVFALGGRDLKDKGAFGVDYYATRLVLTKLSTEVACLLMERGALNASSPIVARLLGEIVARFGLVVTDRAAMSAVPVIGAVGGGAVNMIFMDHFQRVARGHFTIRRLERRYGVGVVQTHYHEIARDLAEARRNRPLLRRVLSLS